MTDINEPNEILDKIKVGIGRGLRIVNIRSKEAYGVIRIKNRIRSLSKRRRTSTEAVGNLVYKMYKYKGKINEDGVMEKCKEIEQIYEEIDRCREELELVHQDAQKALGRLKALSKPEIMGTCECGNQIVSGSEFCSKCFKKVDGV